MQCLEEDDHFEVFSFAEAAVEDGNEQWAAQVRATSPTTSSDPRRQAIVQKSPSGTSAAANH